MLNNNLFVAISGLSGEHCPWSIITKCEYLCIGFLNKLLLGTLAGGERFETQTPIEGPNSSSKWSWQEEPSKGGIECTILAHIPTGSNLVSIQNKNHLH
jgi:hypothetical protein